jgi:hypothetical protein
VGLDMDLLEVLFYYLASLKLWHLRFIYFFKIYDENLSYFFFICYRSTSPFGSTLFYSFFSSDWPPCEKKIMLRSPNLAHCIRDLWL